MNDIDPADIEAALKWTDRKWIEQRTELLRQLEEGPVEDAPWKPPVRLWEEGGIHCAILRNRFGGLCGYAMVPEGHPWWRLTYRDPVPNPKELDTEQPVEQAMDDHGVIPVFAAMLGDDEGVEELSTSLAGQVQVHGGVTWTGPMPIEGAPWGWWIGFDCGHGGDAIDPEWARENEMYPGHADFNEEQIRLGSHVWTEEEVAMEVSRMVTAIKEAAGDE